MTEICYCAVMNIQGHHKGRCNNCVDRLRLEGELKYEKGYHEGMRRTIEDVVQFLNDHHDPAEDENRWEACVGLGEKLRRAITPALKANYCAAEEAKEAKTLNQRCLLCAKPGVRYVKTRGGFVKICYTCEDVLAGSGYILVDPDVVRAAALAPASALKEQNNTEAADRAAAPKDGAK